MIRIRVIKQKKEHDLDAIALLGNLGIKVKVIGIGKVKNQSIQPGQNLDKNKTIILELS